MILYDDKHNFLGMSSHTLGFLGYEDVGEFLSMHNDFANLFVNREGFIYDFDNFNWIDFVLYSGASNKSAIVTLKNGKETPVDLSIKEVHLAHELNGINKLYSVKLISDNFHEISGVPKAEESVGGIGGFSLSGLVEKESKIEEEVQIQPEQNALNTFIQEPTEQESQKSESFILNIGEDNLTKSEPVETFKEQDRVIEAVEDDFKLDFIKDVSETIETPNSDFLLQSDTPQEPLEEEHLLKKLDQEPTEESNFILKEPDPQPQSQEPPLDFLLKTDTPLESTLDEKYTQEEDKTSGQFDFNLLKRDSEEKTPPLDIKPLELNEESVLDDLDTPNMELQNEAERSTTDESGFKLDFLKMDLNSGTITEEESLESQTDFSTLKQKDNEEIIQQIKNDLKEIDAVPEEEHSLAPEIPTMPQVEQPLEIDQRVNEEPTQKELSDFQINESLSHEANRSFTTTLKGLFGTKADEREEQTSTDADDNAFNFQIKGHKTEKFETKENIFPKSGTLETETQELSLSSLKTLGLSADDEHDLLNDFFLEAKESIETIELFIQTKDFDKINYALVKIKSSAEILNLDAIISNANSIRKYCTTENSEQIIQETQKLKDNIRLLEKQLEVTAI